jgi:hypothetical protein
MDPLKWWFVDQRHAMMRFDTGHVHQNRRVDTPTAVAMSINNVVGSGTMAFAAATEPLPAVWPKFARHVLKRAGVPSDLRRRLRNPLAPA